MCTTPPHTVRAVFPLTIVRFIRTFPSMTQAEHIIRAFGGVRPMAAAIQKPPSTVQSWKDSGFIPARHQPEILKAGQKLAPPLTAHDFLPSQAEDAA